MFFTLPAPHYSAGGSIPAPFLFKLIPFCVSLLAWGVQPSGTEVDEQSPDRRAMRLVVALHQNYEDFLEAEVASLQVTTQVLTWPTQARPTGVARCFCADWRCLDHLEGSHVLPLSTRCGDPASCSGCSVGATNGNGPPGIRQRTGQTNDAEHPTPS